MGNKANLHRETLKAALRVIQTTETLEQARIQLAPDAEYFRQARGQGHERRRRRPRGRATACRSAHRRRPRPPISSRFDVESRTEKTRSESNPPSIMRERTLPSLWKESRRSTMETFVRVETAEGRSAIAVVRVWGRRAVEVVDAIFRPACARKTIGGNAAGAAAVGESRSRRRR